VLERKLFIIKKSPKPLKGLFVTIRKSTCFKKFPLGDLGKKARNV